MPGDGCFICDPIAQEEVRRREVEKQVEKDVREALNMHDDSSHRTAESRRRLNDVARASGAKQAMSMKPLSKADRDRLDEAMYNRLKPTLNKPEWSIQSDFELHTEAEVLDSLQRLERAGRVTRSHDKANGWRTWTAVTEEADCVACEIASITYSDYGRVHTCNQKE